MDIKNFREQLELKRKEIEKLMRKKMPLLAGRIAKKHFQDNFKQGGFVNGGLHPWQKAKRLTSGSKSAAGNYGTLLSSRNYLYNEIKDYPQDSRVIIRNTVPYAAIHNYGGTVSPTVTPKMRRFAWAKFYEETGKKKGMNKADRQSAVKNASSEANMWRGLALTKKQKLTIHMPMRMFIGESKELTNKVNDKLVSELEKILNT